MSVWLNSEHEELWTDLFETTTVTLMKSGRADSPGGMKTQIKAQQEGEPQVIPVDHIFRQSPSGRVWGALGGMHTVEQSGTGIVI